MAVNEPEDVEQRGSFFFEQRLLADKLSAALQSGVCDASLRHGVHTLFPGCRFLSLSLPLASPEKELLCTANLATDARLSTCAVPLNQAAAGLTLLRHQWLHVTRSSMPGATKYTDLHMAWDVHGSEAVIFAPVLARPPAWTRCDWHMPALGVITLGVDTSTLVDARLLTSLFLLAHLVGERIVKQRADSLLKKQLMAMSAPHHHQQRATAATSAGHDHHQQCAAATSAPRHHHHRAAAGSVPSASSQSQQQQKASHCSDRRHPMRSAFTQPAGVSKQHTRHDGHARFGNAGMWEPVLAPRERSYREGMPLNACVPTLEKRTVQHPHLHPRRFHVTLPLAAMQPLHQILQPPEPLVGQ